MQAIDPEALQTDGLDLNIVEQMQDMTLEQDMLEEPSTKSLTPVFETTFQSTKV